MKQVYILMIGLFILAGCSMEESPMVPDVPEAPNPVLSVFSNVDGVQIEVYSVTNVIDQLMAKSTPVAEFSGTAPMIRQEFLADLYAVKVFKEGYYTQVEHHELSMGDSLSLDVHLEMIPEDEPEPEELTASLALPYAAQVDEIITIEIRTNGILGILSVGGEVHFTQSGTYFFDFTPREARNYYVSYFVLGEADQIATLLGTLTVVPPTEQIDLNAWIDGSDTIPAGQYAYFDWTASADVDSVTIDGYNTDGNVGHEGPGRVEILSDRLLTVNAWNHGQIVRSVELQFYVESVIPDPAPVLHFRGSGEQIAEGIYQVERGSQVWLLYLVENHNQNTDEVTVDKYPGVEFGASGLQPVTVNADTTFTMTVKRNGVDTSQGTVTFIPVDGPVIDPGYIEMGWDVDGWVGQRSQDPHQIDLMKGIRLPTNLRTEVYAHLEYSEESEGQDDESCALGFLVDGREYWAYGDDPSCPVFPDQGYGIDEMLYVGTVVGFGEEYGRMVMRTGIDFDCWEPAAKCVNPNSVHIQRVLLRIYLP